MTYKLITLLHRSRWHEINATGTNWNGAKTIKRRRLITGWQNRKKLHLVPLCSSSPQQYVRGHEWKTLLLVEGVQDGRQRRRDLGRGACWPADGGAAPGQARAGQQARTLHPHGTERRRLPGRGLACRARMGSACGAWGHGVVALGGVAKGQRWCCSVEQRRTKKLRQPAMVDPRRRRKREVREMMNGHGFVKRMARRCIGRRDLPRGGGSRRRNATVWPEKLAGSSPET